MINTGGIVRCCAQVTSCVEKVDRLRKWPKTTEPAIRKSTMQDTFKASFVEPHNIFQLRSRRAKPIARAPKAPAAAP